jgi:hypothetical protein
MNKAIKILRKLGFHIYKYGSIAKFMTFIYSWMNMEVYWVLKEQDGYWVVNCGDIERLNQINKMRNKKKIRIRDLNNSCVFRHPKKTWGKLKVISK